MYHVQSLLIRASKVRDESAKIKKLKVNAKYIVRNYISNLNSHIISLSFGIYRNSINPYNNNIL